MIANGSSLTSMEHAAAAYGFVHAGDDDKAATALTHYLWHHNLVPQGVTPDLDVEQQPLTSTMDDNWVIVSFDMPDGHHHFSILALRADPTQRCAACGTPTEGHCQECGTWNDGH